MNDERINQRGLRIVLESEEEASSRPKELEPWIVAGERDGLEESILKGIDTIEMELKPMFAHTCTNSKCLVRSEAEAIMAIRRLIQPLKTTDVRAFELIYMVLAVRALSVRIKVDYFVPVVVGLHKSLEALMRMAL